jgi:hypothetical protein
MQKQSFIKYLLNKINSKLTIISKILLLVFSCSLFIPIPTGTTIDANIMTKLLTCYLSLVTTYGAGLVLFLAATYLDFISNTPSENNKFKLLVTIIIIAPIISYTIYLIFNIITPFQLASMLPAVALFIMYIIELECSSRFTFDFTKIKKIFFKK